MEDLVLQRVIVGVLGEQLGERLYPLRYRRLGAWHRRVEREDHPVVLVSGGEELVVDLLEIVDVIGDDRPSLRCHASHQVEIGAAE